MKSAGFEFLKYYLQSLYIYNGTVFSLIKNVINTKNTAVPKGNGFDSHACTPGDSLLTIISSRNRFSKEQQNNTAVDAKSNSNGQIYLSHIIDLCHKNNIQLVLFTSPFYYMDGVNIRDYSDSLNVFLKQNQVPYFNYSGSMMSCLKSPTLWSDYAHLNIEGAKIFSGVFAHIDF